MENSLASNILKFLKKEKIRMKLKETSDSEFWLESQDGLLVMRLILDHEAHEIRYDVFSPKYDVHLKEETLRDVERLDYIAEEAKRWEYEKSIEDFWLVLDCIKIWAQKNGFNIKEARLI